MNRRDVYALVCMATGLAALLARIVALALADLDEGLRDFACEESYVPADWIDDEVES